MIHQIRLSDKNCINILNKKVKTINISTYAEIKDTDLITAEIYQDNKYLKKELMLTFKIIIYVNNHINDSKNNYVLGIEKVILRIS